MIKKLLEKVEKCGSNNLNLFFISRKLKDGIKTRDKVLEKYKFITYSVDINEEIKKHLYDLTIKQLKNVIKKEYETTEYDVVSDDIEQIFTYSMKNKAMSFADVVNNQFNNKSKITKIKDFWSFNDKEELWAYCVGFYNDINEWIYTFRKILKSKVVLDEKERQGKKKRNYFIAKFDTTSSKLEMFHGDTISLDESIDCIYDNEMFFIIKKTLFEQITGLTEEFKDQANEIAQELADTGLIKGIELIEKLVEEKPAIHKKLVRLKKVDNYQNLKSSDITKMLKIAKKYGGSLKKDKDGHLLIENETEIDLTLKVLVDFFKKGEFSGKPYGTFSGKKLVESKE